MLHDQGTKEKRKKILALHTYIHMNTHIQTYS